MNHKLSRIAALSSILAVGAFAAPAMAAPPAGSPGAAKQAAKIPTTNAGKAKAYGKLCAAESKKHERGQKGTDFSRCVNAMAKTAKAAKAADAAGAKKPNPTTACKTLSKKHTKGEKGTPYSRCVSAAAKMLRSKPVTS